VIVVADSSPLIAFAILDKLSILSRIFDELWVPPAVYAESTVAGKPFKDELQAFCNGKIKPVIDTLAVKVLSTQIDLGEAEAIVLAMENGIQNILIDDYRARRTAQASGLFTIGTVGVLVKAKKNGMIASVHNCMEQLSKQGIWISSEIRREALRLANEL
jgi:uncharacterized protein